MPAKAKKVTQVDWLRTQCVFGAPGALSAGAPSGEAQGKGDHNRGPVELQCNHCAKKYTLKQGWAGPSSFVNHLKTQHQLSFRQQASFDGDVKQELHVTPFTTVPAQMQNDRGPAVQPPVGKAEDLFPSRSIPHVRLGFEKALLAWMAETENRTLKTPTRNNEEGPARQATAPANEEVGEEEEDPYEEYQAVLPPHIARLVSFLPPTTRQEALLKTLEVDPSLITSEKEEDAASVLDLLNADDDDQEVIYHAVKAVRKSLSVQKDAPVERLIGLGAVPRLITLAATEKMLNCIRFEAAWAITNIASGTSAQTVEVVSQGGIEALVSITKLDVIELQEQGCWGLGNIAGDSAQLRDAINVTTFPDRLLQLLEQAATPAEWVTQKAREGLLKNAAWTLAQLVRGSPKVDLASLKKLLPGLCHLLERISGPIRHLSEVIVDVFWGLSYASEAHEHYSHPTIAPMLSTILDTLTPQTPANIATPALRILGNLVNGTDEMTERVLRAGMLPTLLVSVLNNPAATNIAVKEAIWMISNIAAGTQDQVRQCAASGVMSNLVSRLNNHQLDALQMKEAIWVFSNAVAGAAPDVVRKFFCGAAPNGLDPKAWNIVAVLCEFLKYLPGGILHHNTPAFGPPVLHQPAIHQFVEGMEAAAPFYKDMPREVLWNSQNVIEEYVARNDDGTLDDVLEELNEFLGIEESEKE